MKLTLLLSVLTSLASLATASPLPQTITQADIDALNSITPAQWELLHNSVGGQEKRKRQVLPLEELESSIYVPNLTPAQVQAINALPPSAFAGNGNGPEKMKREPQGVAGGAGGADLQDEVQGGMEANEETMMKLDEEILEATNSGV